MQDLARECTNLISMVHVSSTFVNSNRPFGSIVEEKCYEPKFDPEELINRIMQMNPQELEIEQPKILEKCGFSNTYTFTKNMAEVVMERRSGDMRISVLRPATINACFREPFPGWLD